MHFTISELDAMANPIGNGYRQTVVTLDGTMTADNPASTRDTRLYGPATVTYLFAPSGAITATVTA